MRFLNGLLGAWAGLCIASFVANIAAGDVGQMPIVGFAVINLVFAAIGAISVFFTEKTSWSMGKYAIVGMLTTGLSQLVMVVAIGWMLASASGGLSVSLLGLLGVVATCAITGAVSGVGYRMLSGDKPAA